MILNIIEKLNYGASCVVIRSMSSKKNQVAIIMGSLSDHKVMKPGIDLLKEWRVKTELKIVSAHRTPELMQDYAY